MADYPQQPTDIAPRDEAREIEIAQEADAQRLSEILPVAEIDLTDPERARVTQALSARLIMGDAGAAAMTCSDLCPFRMECQLYIVRKHPIGRICPTDVAFLRERFMEWLRELGRTLDTLLASERQAIGSLCSLQLELQRVRLILSRAQNAEMNQVSVRDVNAETGDPLCWENMIHTAAQREDQILLDIRMIMKDFELTPEQKTRRAKALGLRTGNDVANKQSSLFEKINQRRRRVIEAAPSS